MRKYNLVNRQILFTFLVFLSIPASLFIGCSRSEDALPEKTENDVLKKFFNVPESASQAANAVAALIKRQNEKTHFIENFIKRVGYPKWDKAMEFAPNNSGVSGRFQSDDVSIIYIPFVRETENHVNASLIVKMEPSDTLFRMLYDKQYTRFGFDSTSENRWNAKNVFHIFSRFDNLVFGYTKFIIKDGRIFGKDSASPYQIKLLQENSISGSGRLSMVQPITVCNTYVICGECAAFRTSSLACCNPYSQTVCTTYWIDMGGDGTGGGGSGDTGGGGGSGGGGDWSDDPCDGWTPASARVSILEPCGNEPGWEPAEDVVVSVNIVTNNINEICLNEVYNKITENNYKNELSLMFKSFQVSDQVTISLNTDNTLPTNVYGKAYQQANSETYNIDLNTAVLKRCSQEFIASIYFHEAIHVYLKEHQDTWNTQTSSEHLEMLREYFDKLTKSVREIFPSLPEMDAYCIILDCIQNSDKDSDFSQAIFDVIKASYLYIMQSKYPVLASESEIQAIADLYREDGLLGTRNSNCN